MQAEEAKDSARNVADQAKHAANDAAASAKQGAKQGAAAASNAAHDVKEWTKDKAGVREHSQHLFLWQGSIVVPDRNHPQ
jgi:methyl-accepting chemotaxis protein